MRAPCFTNLRRNCGDLMRNTLLFLSILFWVAACSVRPVDLKLKNIDDPSNPKTPPSGGSAGGSSSSSSNTNNSSTGTSGNISASIELISPQGSIPVGSQVTFRVKAQGRTRFRVVLGDGSSYYFSSSITFSRAYFDCQKSVIETVRVFSADGGAVIAPVAISFGPFPVMGSPFCSPVSCTASVFPSVIEVPVTPDLVPIEGYPPVEFRVWTDRPSWITEVYDVGKIITPEVPLPVPVDLPFRARFPSYGVKLIAESHTVQFIVRDSANHEGTCSATFQVVPKIVIPPEPPTCTLAADKASVVQGGSLTLTLTSFGAVDAAFIGTTPVSVKGGTHTIEPATLGTATSIAAVTGPGGAGTCTATYEIRPKKQACWIGVREVRERRIQEGRVFIGALPSDFEKQLRDWVNSSSTSVSTKLAVILPYQAFYDSTKKFRTQPTKSITIEGYEYQFYTNNNMGSEDCPLIIRSYSPLIVDLRQEGIKLLEPNRGPLFDLEGTGIRSQYSWPSNPESSVFVAYDKNKNGNIDDINELFGDNTVGPDGAKATNGFEALKKHDANQDGIIDASDSIYYSLKLWSDLNSNGYTDSGELSRLSEKGIRSIDLHYTESMESLDTFGNTINERSFVKMTNGESRLIYDAWFVPGSE